MSRPHLLRLFSLVVAIAAASLPAGLVAADRDERSAPILKPGDRVAFLGGAFVERLQEHGVLEAELQCRRPGWNLAFRNLGWSGDNVHGLARKRFDAPEDGYARMLRDVEMADPSVVLVAYGFAEASDGAEAVDAFQPGLERLVQDIRDRGIRVALLAPIAMPGVRVPGYAERIESCRDAVESVGEALELPVISVEWSPSETELTHDRLLPNRFGYAAWARQVADELVGGVTCPEHPPQLLARIAEKNELFFHHYRPQNETYLFLFRKHEQGQNAAEIEQFKPLIAEADRAIWKAAGEGKR